MYSDTPALPSPLLFLQGIDRRQVASELAAISQRIVASGCWRDYVVHSPDVRDYRLIFENAHTDIWVLSWLPGQETGFHDHHISHVGICVADGAICERRVVGGSLLTRDAEIVGERLTEGMMRRGPFGYVYAVAYGAGDPAVSVHAYSPPLRAVGQYRDMGGKVIRVPEPGRTRLAPLT